MTMLIMCYASVLVLSRAGNYALPYRYKKYEAFVKSCHYFDEATIREFADSIDRDPGIVLGRLLKDEKVHHTEVNLSKKLRHTYSVVIG